MATNGSQAVFTFVSPSHISSLFIVSRLPSEDEENIMDTKALRTLWRRKRTFADTITNIKKSCRYDDANAQKRKYRTHTSSGSVTRFFAFVFSWIEPFWVPDKQSKMVLLKNSFSQDIRQKRDSAQCYTARSRIPRSRTLRRVGLRAVCAELGN